MLCLIMSQPSSPFLALAPWIYIGQISRPTLSPSGLSGASQSLDQSEGMECDSGLANLKIMTSGFAETVGERDLFFLHVVVSRYKPKVKLVWEWNQYREEQSHRVEWNLVLTTAFFWLLFYLFYFFNWRIIPLQCHVFSAIQHELAVSIHINTYVCVCVYIYTSMCVCVCVYIYIPFLLCLPPSTHPSPL